MADVLYVVMMVVLIALAAAFVVGCDKLIGSDELELVERTGTRAEQDQPAQDRTLGELAA